MGKLETNNGEADTVFKTSAKDNLNLASTETFDWPPAQTFVYREVNGVQIEADVYVPEIPLDKLDEQRPVALFIHGGGWIGGIRTDLPKPMLYGFLTRGFLFVSIDYRLLPEVDFLTGQLDDVVWAETWIREKLQALLEDRGSKARVDGDAVVVVGGSAGAHLASLTPKVWKTPPRALLLFAGPTNLLEGRNPQRTFGGGRLKDIIRHVPQDPSAEFIKSAMFVSSPTNTSPVAGLEGFMQPRSLIGLSIFLKDVYPESLARGLVNGTLPEKGSVQEDEIKKLSAFFTEPISSYPPTFQIIGDSDEAWDASQLTSFHDKLRQNDVPSAVLVVPEAGHTFENTSKIGNPVHLKYLRTGVEIMCRFVGKSSVEKSVLI